VEAGMNALIKSKADCKFKIMMRWL